MANSVNQIPSELKQLNKLFEYFHYRRDANIVFDDLLTIFINFFSDGLLMKERDEAMAKYDAKDKQVFNEMFYEIIGIFDKMIDDTPGSWYDPFGEYYMYLASAYKQSWFGQFFTPECIVNLMVKMNYSDVGAGKRVNDCCSGSGRLLIAFHAHYPGNYMYAEELDPVCAKMTAINMALHGCEGEVVCHDSLKQDWKFGYKINHLIRLTGLPSITPLHKDESYVMNMWNARLEEKPKDIIKPTNGTAKVVESVGQLTIF